MSFLAIFTYAGSFNAVGNNPSLRDSSFQAIEP